MNLIGEGFPDYVNKQIDVRQKLHGSTNRTTNQLVYLNSKTGWIRLTSGVDIDEERLKLLGLGNEFSGNRLAKNFVLFGGTTENFLNNAILKSGIDRTNSFISNNAYGIGGNDFGIRPMPGVSSIETKFRNRGSVRDGIIQLKAWNKKQFEIIDVLFLRLGYPILLEWGHSIYVDNNGEIQTSPNHSIAQKFLSPGDYGINDDNQILQEIDKERKKSHGNYDAMYGKVINFDWDFNKDGSYNITLKTISLGAIVESIKLNTYTQDITDPSKTPTDLDKPQPTTDEEWVVANQNSHQIGQYFSSIVKYLSSKDNITNHPNVTIASEYDVIKGSNLTNFQNSLDTISNKFEENKLLTAALAPAVGSTYIITKTIQIVKDFLNDTSGTAGPFVDFIKTLQGEDERFYIRLGNFLQFLLTKNLLYNEDNGQPITKIDILPYESNVMYTTPHQVSGDPRICLIGGFNVKTSENINIPILRDTVDNKKIIEPYKFTISGNEVGLIMNIYVDMGFILSKIDSLKDDKNKVGVYDFLNGILIDISKALGGINKLEAIIDEEKNLIKIIDNTAIPNRDNIIKTLDPNGDVSSTTSTKIELLGYNFASGSAGFVKDVKLKTEISNELSSMLSIGAASNGSSIGEDATAFSKWNNGLSPRINKKITDVPPGVKVKQEEDKQKLLQQEENANRQLIEAFDNFILHYQDLDFETEALNGFQDTYNNYLSFLRKQEHIQNPTKISPNSGGGFLPISLGLTMDGLSGIKIYQKLEVDTRFLPIQYPDALEFIIKGVTHRVDSGGWNISLETMSVPSQKGLLGNDNNQYTPSSVTTTNKPIEQSLVVVNQDLNAKVFNNNAKKLRDTLKSLGYTEKGNEIDSGGKDISVEIERAASSILKTIKKELPDIKVTVTGGEDKYHQGLSYDSRHKKGDAIDFVIYPSTTSNLDKVVNILQRYAAGNAPNFRFIDEYRHLTSAGTANHFHISWSPGTEGQSELNNALFLAQNGKIQPIKIG